MNERKRPAWKEPMLWLVVGVPLVALVAGIWLVVVAVRSGGADGTTDDVRRTGQVQVADLGPDTRAADRGLRAVLQLIDGRVRVFPVAGDLPRDQSLVLALVHPQRASADHVLTLAPDDTGWHGEDAALAGNAGHDWIVQLGDVAGEWRIRGRLPAGQQAAHLAPALGGQ